MTTKPLPLLITGFKPFLADTINPSELLVKTLVEELPDIQGVVLPVSYENSYAELKKIWSSQSFAGLIMLGQAGGRGSVCLERIAVNWAEGSSPDEDGQIPPTGPLQSEGPPAHINGFFPGDWQKRLSHFGPVQVSFSAGTYVCNALYYRVLNELCRPPHKSLFVHVPYLPEQTLRTPSTPSMDFQTQKTLIKELVKLWRG